jgi:hypothetical protein
MSSSSTISLMDAGHCVRVLLAIERQIEIATREERADDCRSLCRLLGGLEYRMFGYGSRHGPDSPWCYVPAEKEARNG